MAKSTSGKRKKGSPKKKYVKKGAKKASARRKAAKKAPAKKTLARKKTAKKTTAKKTLARKKTAKKTTAKKTLARKKTAKKTTAKKTLARKKTAKKTTAKKTLARKKTAKKTTAKKTLARKKTAKKTTAKKTLARKKTAKKTTAKKTLARKKTVKKTSFNKKTMKKSVKKTASKKASSSRTVKKTAARQSASKAYASLRKPPSSRRPIAHAAPSSAKATTKTRYSKEELVEFENLILKKLANARKEFKALREALNRGNDEGTESTSGGHAKVLEDGAETAEKENLNQLAARQLKYVNNLEQALIRIKRGSYGICSVTGKLIPKERLIAVPHTTQSIEAKMMRRD